MDILAALNSYPFTAAQRARVDRRWEATFPELASWPSAQRFPASRYVVNRPEKFFSREVFRDVSAWLVQVHPQRLHIPTRLSRESVEASLLALDRANASLVDEELVRPAPEERDFHLVEVTFSQYARIAESIYSALLGYALELVHRCRGVTKELGNKGGGTELRNRWEMAVRWLPPRFSLCFDPTVRNAIIHANVRIAPDEVVFSDDKGKQVALSRNQAADLTFGLLSVCNGIAAAITIHSAAAASPAQDWPGLGVRRLLHEAWSPIWHVESHIETQQHHGRQLEIFGRHAHWRSEELLVDVCRTLILARTHAPAATRFFLSMRGPYGSPCFFGVDTDAVPAPDADAAQLASLVASLAGSAHVEHHRWLPALISRWRKWSAVFSWWNSANIPMFSGDQPDYELRHLKNNSVGWRARFHATVLSTPRAQDLLSDGTPTIEYLDFLFRETMFRWLARTPSRPYGASKFRVFRSGLIEVHAEDSRRVGETGLTPNFLFRFEAALGPALRIPLLGTMPLG